MPESLRRTKEKHATANSICKKSPKLGKLRVFSFKHTLLLGMSALFVSTVKPVEYRVAFLIKIYPFNQIMLMQLTGSSSSGTTCGNLWHICGYMSKLFFYFYFFYILTQESIKGREKINLRAKCTSSAMRNFRGLGLSVVSFSSKNTSPSCFTSGVLPKVPTNHQGQGQKYTDGDLHYISVWLNRHHIYIAPLPGPWSSLAVSRPLVFHGKDGPFMSVSPTASQERTSDTR